MLEKLKSIRKQSKQSISKVLGEVKRLWKQIKLFLARIWASSRKRREARQASSKLLTWPEMAQYDFLGRVLFRKMGINVMTLALILLAFAVCEETATRVVEKYPRTVLMQLGDVLWDFVLMPTLWSHYALTYRRIPSLFQQLSTITKDQESSDFNEFIERVKRSLASPMFPLLACVSSLSGQAILFFGTWQSSPPGFYPWPAHVAYSLILGTLALYAAVLLLLREVLTIRWLSYFFRHFQLRVHALYPDNAGGFEFIGIYYLNLVLFVVVAGMMISLWSVIVPVVHGTPILPGVVWPLAWMGYIVVTPATFFLPLWSGHLAMKREKANLIRVISSQFDVDFDLVLYRIAKDSETIEQRTQKIEFLRELREFVDKTFPVWPYSTQIGKRFSISASLPVITSVVSLIIDIIVK